MSELLSSVTPQVDALVARLRSLDRRVYVPAVVSAVVTAITASWAIGNYREFVELGPGGVPYNVFGWLWNVLMHPLGKEMLGTKLYDQDADKSTWLGDPATFPQRRGSRPKTSWHYIPHRQLEQFPSPQMKQKMLDLFAERAAKNADITEVRMSIAEKRHDGLFIKEGIPTPHTAAAKCSREILHVHIGRDHSMHLTLSPVDCKTAIEKGWAQRHPISGSVKFPKEFVMIYAPRDEEEALVVERIMKASIGYMTNTRNVL